MATVQVAESNKPKSKPKVLDHLELHGQLGGGHIVKHVYTDYSHDPKEVKFNKAGKSQGGEHVVAHLTKHGGLPGGAEEEAETGEVQD